MANAKFSVDLPEDLDQRFDAWVKKRKFVKRQAVIAALESLMQLPPVMRDLVMEGDWAAAKAWLEAADYAWAKRVVAARGSSVREDPPEHPGGKPGRGDEREK